MTRAQLAAIDGIYSPTRVNGKTIYPGQPFGNETGWGTWITGVSAQAMNATNKHAPTSQGAFGTEFFKYFVFGDSAWDYTHYDFSHIVTDGKRADYARFDANATDLSAFKARGGKLIIAHGWSDPALNALSSIEYFAALKAHDKSADGYVRLFLLPGVLHCAGGSGCDIADWYTPIADWTERGVVPARIVASKLGAAPSQGAPRPTVRTRAICAYPQHAIYAGTGSTDDEKSFVCK